MVEPDSALESNDSQGISKGMQRNVIATDANRPKAVAGKRIDEIERPHDEDLFPPPRAVLTNLVWHRGRGVIRHDVYTLGRQGKGLTPSVGLAR